jgi:hypothetical protein
MSKEIDDLFEINTNLNVNNPIKKGISVIKHFFIHMGSFLFINVLGLILATKVNGYEAIGVAMYLVGLLLLLFVVTLIEAIVFQVKKNYQLRNSSLLLLLIYIFGMTIILIKMGF